MRLTKTAKPAVNETASLPEGVARALAVECWRIRKLVPTFADNRKHLVLRSSVDRMVDSLQTLGIAIEDPEGSEFKDGMTLQIAVFENSDELEVGRRVVSETLSPHVYIHKKLAQTARVIVAVGRKEAQHGA